MEQVHEGLENKSFPDKPAGIVTVQVCADCGLKPSALCSQDYRGSRVISVEMQESAVPTETCTCHVEAVFCTESGKLANEFCPEECRETRVLVQGREFLDTVYGGAPQLNEDGTYTVGNLISAADDAAHLTYNQIQGTCTTHTEETVPPDVLVPGDDGFEWPEWWPWNPGDGDEDGNTDPGGNSDGNSGNNSGNNSGGGTNEPTEPVEPTVPTEPAEP